MPGIIAASIIALVLATGWSDSQPPAPTATAVPSPPLTRIVNVIWPG
jgi:hypothetical protein